MLCIPSVIWKRYHLHWLIDRLTISTSSFSSNAQNIQVCQPPPYASISQQCTSADNQTAIHTTVSVTNGVGVHARGGLELDSKGMEFEKLRNRAGWSEAAPGLRRASRPSRNKERLGFIAGTSGGDRDRTKECLKGESRECEKIELTGGTT